MDNFSTKFSQKSTEFTSFAPQNSAETQPRSRQSVQLHSKDKIHKAFYKVLRTSMAYTIQEFSEYEIHMKLLCDRFVTYYNATEDVRIRGETITQIGDKGQEREILNPYSAVRDKAYKDIIDGLRECGLTVRSKSQLNSKGAEGNDNDDLLRALNGDIEI